MPQSATPFASTQPGSQENGLATGAPAWPGDNAVSQVQPPQAGAASLGELFSDLSTDMSALLRDELQLAKVELKEEITKVGRAGGMFGGAALAGYMTIVLLSFAAAWVSPSSWLWGGRSSSSPPSGEPLPRFSTYAAPASNPPR